jgi:MoaA/NifB/PqqE/SkfB family radical SAM enzyme
MRLKVVEQAVRNVAIRAEIYVNRLLHREFIPADIGTFNIETSSACNLKCRFCAYEKKSSPKVSMSNEMFFDCVNQATELGFRRFHLTPCTGDVFMDKHVFEKLAFLDQHPKVSGYHFFTNLTISTRAQLLRLMDHKKFERLTISVYGHDEESFIAIAKSTPKIYRRLIANLKTVLEHLDRWPFSVSIGFRSTFGVPAADSSELMALLSEFRRAGVRVHSSHGVYNNWGGYITQQDVADLDMHIIDGDSVHHSGACVKLFDSVQIMATGVVNACACRDVDATLKIGSVQERPLKEIINARNAEYMQIIKEQQEGNFRPVCKGCDYYRSIYHQPKNFRRNNIPTQSIAQFLTKLSGERE